ncbi:hypothetical protein PF008_g13250 [Phytophthora fragariae]|uniref:Histone-lysine N-methyltransferase n=1 Tax=Phytophthora fragariae TaxID=53985 RepID=A0A6G0RL04_9STRA|nr:hypothetical protein PF008_g13250 [Phytophthora fragariae]
MRVDVRQSALSSVGSLPFAIKANVCKGGEWLVPPKDDVQECDCVVVDESGYGCGEGCINRALRYECVVERCPCGLQCTNRQMQLGSTVAIGVIDCSRRGVGVVALEAVDAEQFIGEYVGEVISSREACQRAKLYQHADHWYMLQASAEQVIDATCVGGRMRFVNHSCQPNCREEKWCVRGHERCGLFATRQIGAGEELTFDYQFHAADGARAIECLCGSQKCRGEIGVRKRPRSDQEVATYSNLSAPIPHSAISTPRPHKRMRQLTMDSFL